MFNKSIIAPIAIAALATVNTIRTKIEAKKAAELYLAAYEAFNADIESYEEAQKANHLTIDYLADKLIENDIEMTAFDHIALTLINQ